MIHPSANIDHLLVLRSRIVALPTTALFSMASSSSPSSSPQPAPHPMTSPVDVAARATGLSSLLLLLLLPSSLPSLRLHALLASLAGLVVFLRRSADLLTGLASLTACFAGFLVCAGVVGNEESSSIVSMVMTAIAFACEFFGAITIVASYHRGSEKHIRADQQELFHV